MITVEIDELTPCLRDAKTGEYVVTIARRIKDAKELKSFNKPEWATDWKKLYPEHEIYALYVKGVDEVQGLVALRPETDTNAVYVAWMCAAPHNQRDNKKYYGVGGHLFAIAAERSLHYGLNGVMYGYAANEQLLNHYTEIFNAEPLGILHPFHFCITEEAAANIVKEYDYDCERTPSKGKG